MSGPSGAVNAEMADVPTRTANTKAELNRRSQGGEVLTGTGISRRENVESANLLTRRVGMMVLKHAGSETGAPEAANKRPRGLGLRQPSAAFTSSALRGKSGGGPPHSKTLPRHSITQSPNDNRSQTPDGLNEAKRE